MSKATDTLVFPSRDGRIRHWAKNLLGTIEHESRVAEIARTLFQLTREWHPLRHHELRLLGLASLLHDVGRVESDEGHEKIGARLIVEGSDLPVSDAERRRLAFLTRYHRGSVPDTGEERYLDPRADDLGTMRMILGFLRAADSLDSRAVKAPHLVATKHGRTVTVYGYVADPAAAGKLGKPKKFKLLESMLGCKFQTHWFLTERLAMVS
jgi:exopolyphosphatase/pppGpp-phosphohydrolase